MTFTSGSMNVAAVNMSSFPELKDIIGLDRIPAINGAGALGILRSEVQSGGDPQWCEKGSPGM